MSHFATPDFWYCYRHLPDAVRALADKNFELLRNDLQHPSLRFKQIGSYYSARVGLHYRALARARTQGAIAHWREREPRAQFGFGSAGTTSMSDC